MNVSMLKTIVKWVLISNVFAAVVGVLTLPWRSQMITALNSLGVPQPSPAETLVLFVLTVACFYAAASLAESLDEMDALNDGEVAQ